MVQRNNPDAAIFVILGCGAGSARISVWEDRGYRVQEAESPPAASLLPGKRSRARPSCLCRFKKGETIIIILFVRTNQSCNLTINAPILLHEKSVCTVHSCKLRARTPYGNSLHASPAGIMPNLKEVTECVAPRPVEVLKVEEW